MFRVIDVSLYAQLVIALLGSTYQFTASSAEDRQSPPGQIVEIDGRRSHYYLAGLGSPTIVLDHSLGGVEGRFLLDELSKLSRTFVYDRAGYGWSDRRPGPRTSNVIVAELDRILSAANIEPPYLLVGDSFGSYNMRLFAHTYPEKVMGLVLTDGLHETGMLNMSPLLKVLKLFFTSGFLMATLGSSLGMVRLSNFLGLFERLKPELRNWDKEIQGMVKHSFLRPKHWLTMTSEIHNLEKSGEQLKVARSLGDLPIVSIKADSFFMPSILTRLMPLGQANQLRDHMHEELMRLSSDCTQLQANGSGHFVWIDRPDAMLEAVQVLLTKHQSSENR